MRWGAVWLLLLSAVAALPILAFPFRADERFAFYADTARLGANPFRIVAAGIREIPFYINRGNFRPLGRMLDYAEHSFSFEFASFAGVPLPVVHGFFRVAAIGLLGVMGLITLHYMVLSALKGERRSLAAALSHAEVLFPVAYCVSVVAAGAASPFVLFPFLYLVSTALAMGAAAVVSRDSNMVEGSLSVMSIVGYLLLGAIVGSTFDLVYLGGPLLVVLALVRMRLQRIPLSRFSRLRVGKAAMFTLAGFVGVFVPTRLLIQSACSGGACYAASDLSFDPAGLRVFVDRLASGSPFAGWHYVQSAVGAHEMASTVFVSNAGASLLVLVVALYVVMAAARARRVRSASDSQLRTTEHSPPVHRLWTSLPLSACWPFSVLALSSALAALSAKMQSDKPAIGFGWRDSGFAAVGWALLLSIVLGAVVAALRDHGRLRAVVWVVLALMAVMAGKTILVNADVAEAARKDSESVVSNRIAAEVINFDESTNGDQIRCELIGEFSAVFHDRQYPRDAQLADALNRLAMARYHEPFCSRDVLVTAN